MRSVICYIEFTNTRCSGGDLRKLALASLFISSVILSSCGQKSEITPLAQPRKLVDQYGDGEYITRSVRFPLTENSIDAYEDLTRVDGNFAPGILTALNNGLMQLGSSMGLGKSLIQIKQILPEIDPELIPSIKIKKIFFTIDDKVCDGADVDYVRHPLCKKVRRSGGFFGGLFGKKDDKTDFGFVKNAVLHITPSEEIPAEDTTVEFPDVGIKDYRDVLRRAFPKYFDPDYRSNRRASRRGEDLPTESEIATIERNGMTSYELGKYYRGKDAEDIVIGNHIEDTVVIYTNNALILDEYLRNHTRYKAMLESSMYIQGMLFVELKNPKKDMSYFKETLLRDRNLNSMNISLSRVDSCDQTDCITLNMNDVNLMPLFKNKRSAIIDAYLDVKDVPRDVFQLKGYIEFEVKLKLDY